MAHLFQFGVELFPRWVRNIAGARLDVVLLLHGVNLRSLKVAEADAPSQNPDGGLKY